MASLLLAICTTKTASASEAVTFESGDKTLHGFVYKAARARGGQEFGAQTMARLLSTEQLQDQLAALAWLKRQPFARPSQIAVMGNSFGGGRPQPG